MIKSFSLVILLVIGVFVGAALEAPVKALAPTDEAERLARQWEPASLLEAERLLVAELTTIRPGEEAARAARVITALAEVQISLDKLDLAENTLREGSQAVSLDDAARAIVLSELAALAIYRGNVVEADELSRESSTLANRSADFHSLAVSEFALGEISYWKSDLEQALKHYERAAQLSSESRDLKPLARTMLSLGYLWLEKTDFANSRQCFDRAREIWDASDDRRGQALIVRANGWYYSWIGDKRKAVDEFVRAEMMFPAGIESIEKVGLYGGLGTATEDLGDFVASRSYREKALVAARSVGGRLGELIILPDLARVTYLNGDGITAESHLRSAAELARKLNDNFLEAQVRRMTGDFYLFNDRFDDARNEYRDVLKYFQREQRPREIGQVAERMGQLHLKIGDIRGARRFFQVSLQNSRIVRDRLAESQAIFQLAVAEVADGNWREAERLASESITLTDSLVIGVVNSRLKKSFYSNIYERYELRVKSLMELSSLDQSAALDAFMTAEKSRARVMREHLELGNAGIGRSAQEDLAEKELVAKLNARLDELTNVLNDPKDDQSTVAALDDEINSIQNEIEQRRGSSKEMDPLFSGVELNTEFDLPAFRRDVLSTDTVLIEYSIGASASFAWLLDNNRFESVRLPDRVQIAESVARFNESITERQMKEGEDLDEFLARRAELDALFIESCEHLGDMLLGSFAKTIQGKRIIVVADGKLLNFPFGALRSPETGRPLIETNEIVYSPSAQAAALLAATSRRPAPYKDLLVFSDPVYTIDDPRFVTNSELHTEDPVVDRFRFVESLDNLPRLASSKAESEVIGAIISGETAIFTGFDASRRSLKDAQTENYKILHFATHGLVDEVRPEMSGIIFSRFDPSGNRVDEAFRINDIYSLDLNADLVVLSACRTALGKEVRGEGLASLNNAFLQTGARSVLSTLWQVEDGATLELMKHFYAAMIDEKLPPPAALRKAQLALMDNPRYSSPFYWAAFTVQGDFRNVPQIQKNNRRTYLYAGGLFLLVVVVIFAFSSTAIRSRIRRLRRR